MRPLLAAVLLASSCGAGPPEAPLVEPALPPFTVRGRWEDARALTYRIEQAGGPGLSEAVETALDAWSSDGSIGFRPAASEPDVVFRWGRAATDEQPDAPFGRDTSVARTGPVGPGCEVLFNADHAWREGELAGAAVHELGHVLGLDHVELEHSVMHPQRERGADLPGAADRAGLHSLYGGGPDRADASGDVRGEGFVLRAVAPPALADWTLFDTDGDGRDEVLVWATGEVGHGVLTIYRFDSQQRLEHTWGPYLGVAGHGARVTPGSDDQGRRTLEVTWPDGSTARRTFKPSGALGP